MDTMRTISPQSTAEYPSLEQASGAGEQRKPATIRQWFAWILHGFKVQRTRRVLRLLSDDELRDIGLRPDQAAREAKRPIWDRSMPFDRWG